ncbi:MAG: alpha-galactosidase [Ruminococcaceae bacterium]|nr:alpha-galactosidase [Oscillospiraceae bacterium]
MAITVNEGKIFTINTKNTMYQMYVNEEGVLFHSYYGAKIGYSDLSYLSYKRNWIAAFSPNPRGKDYSHNQTKDELSVFGNGDFRLTALSLVNHDGTTACEPVYYSHQILNGKYSLEGLPAFYGDEGETLVITLKDKAYDIYFHMYYGVFSEYDLITKALVIENKTDKQIKLNKALSLTLDLSKGTYDIIHFHGAHARERMYERTRITHLKSTVSSNRGASSHLQNPFVIVCDKDANEEHGNAYGVGLVYSGNFVISAERDQYDLTRVVAGINPEGFEFTIEPNDSFTTPEVALVYSNEGFGKLSNCYHKAVRNNLCRGKFKNARRPVLINNWEGTYFDFNADKLVNMARDASKIGVELFVMDDGWFGHRDDDFTSLGDWFVNEEKLQGTLENLVKRINAEGLDFGIWFEPECISEDSVLYREHPDYCFKIPNRDPQMSRNQLVLDMSRKEVRDNIYNQMVKVLNSANITYVKWDFNRNLCDLYSVELPRERQGEIYHRYMLGVYELLERITSSFPDILFESCSGGGGRFDLGMLYYMPQVWTSDNSDAIDRLKIQYGTSFAYPVRTMGAHVSVCPNHGNARVTPLSTRGNVAYFGTYGLELDITKMTEEEKEEVKRQIVEFKQYYDLIQYGDYYRLLSPYTPDESRYCAWEVVKEDKSEALVCTVAYEAKCTVPPETLKVRGLDPDKFYRINGSSEAYLGGALMNGGFWLDYDHVSYASRLYHITQI